jgi:transcriptional regulator with XRE-family HTH domain
MKDKLEDYIMFPFNGAPGSTEKQFGKYVREMRLEMGLTQEQFAAKLGVSFPTVNRWENQKAKPSPLALEKLQKLIMAFKKKNQSNRKIKKS